VYLFSPGTSHIISAKQVVINVAGKIVSGPYLIKNNKMRSLRGQSTVSVFMMDVFGKLEEDGLGRNIRRMANNNASVSNFESEFKKCTHQL